MKRRFPASVARDCRLDQKQRSRFSIRWGTERDRQRHPADDSHDPGSDESGGEGTRAPLVTEQRGECTVHSEEKARNSRYASYDSKLSDARDGDLRVSEQQ